MREEKNKKKFTLSQAVFSLSLSHTFFFILLCKCRWLTDWLTRLTNWLSTFDCLPQIDLCMWIRYFAAVGFICLLFLIYYLLRRIESIENIECFHFNSIFFSIRFRYLIYVIESNRFDSKCLHIQRENERNKQWHWLVKAESEDERENSNGTKWTEQNRNELSESENANKHRTVSLWLNVFRLSIFR